MTRWQQRLLAGRAHEVKPAPSSIDSGFIRRQRDLEGLDSAPE